VDNLWSAARKESVDGAERAESGRAFQSTSSGEVRVFIDVCARGKRGKCMGSTLSWAVVGNEPELNLHREFFCRTEVGARLQ